MRGPWRMDGEASDRERNADRGDDLQTVAPACEVSTRVPNATLGEDVAVGTRNEHHCAGVAGMVIERDPKMHRALRCAQCSRAQNPHATPRSLPRDACRPRRRSGTKPDWTRGWPQPVPGRSRAARNGPVPGRGPSASALWRLAESPRRTVPGSAGGAGCPSGRRADRLVPRRRRSRLLGGAGSVTRRNPSSLYCDNCSRVSIDAMVLAWFTSRDCRSSPRPRWPFRARTAKMAPDVPSPCRLRAFGPSKSGIHWRRPGPPCLMVPHPVG